MKRAIIYTRVSTDEQADRGYSLRDQEDRLRKYCELKGYVITAHYQDDYSAKTFERPQFNLFLQQIKNRSLKGDFLLFIKWDRFSRNTSDSYAMIAHLLKNGIEAQAVEQPIDFAIPEQRLMLAFYLSAPEVENLRRGLNTQAGNRRALKEGRYIHKAPRGYKYEVQSDGRPMIVPDGNSAWISKAFDRMASGLYSVDQLYLQMRREGYKGGRSMLYTLLRNPVYMGCVRVPAKGDDPERIIDAQHEGIVTKQVWADAQEAMDGRRKKQVKTTTNYVNLPLRGHMVCPKCGGNLTGSGSKNRKKEVYYYYHCRKPCSTRFRADLANDKLLMVMQSFVLPQPWGNAFYIILKEYLSADTRRRTQEMSQTRQQIVQAELRLEEAENMLFDKTITPEVYTKAKNRYTGELTLLEERVKTLDSSDAHTDEMLRYTINLVSNLPKIYSQAIVEVKQKLLCSIFPEKLVFDGKEYRTHKVNPLLEIFKQKFSELQGRSSPSFRRDVRVGTRSRTIVEHISSEEFLDSLEALFALKELIPVDELV